MLDNNIGNGNMAVTYSYDAWGNTLSSKGTANTADSSQNLKDVNIFRYSGYFYNQGRVLLFTEIFDQRYFYRINPYLYTNNNPIVIQE